MEFQQHHLWLDPKSQKHLKNFHYALIDGKEVQFTHWQLWQDGSQVPANAKYLGVGDYLRAQEHKTLFLALIEEHYRAFEDGSKPAEYRRYGGQFTEKNWFPGRRVNLRRGYSTNDNLYGVVTSFKVFRKSQIIGPLHKTIVELYGPEDEEICEIGIKIDGE